MYYKITDDKEYIWNQKIEERYHTAEDNHLSYIFGTNFIFSKESITANACISF